MCLKKIARPRECRIVKLALTGLPNRKYINLAKYLKSLRVGGIQVPNTASSFRVHPLLKSSINPHTTAAKSNPRLWTWIRDLLPKSKAKKRSKKTRSIAISSGRRWILRTWKWMINRIMRRCRQRTLWVSSSWILRRTGRVWLIIWDSSRSRTWTAIPKSSTMNKTWRFQPTL